MCNLRNHQYNICSKYFDLAIMSLSKLLDLVEEKTPNIFLIFFHDLQFYIVIFKKLNTDLSKLTKENRVLLMDFLCEWWINYWYPMCVLQSEDRILIINCSLSVLLILLWESKTTNEVATVISSDIFHNTPIKDSNVPVRSTVFNWIFGKISIFFLPGQPFVLKQIPVFRIALGFKDEPTVLFL